MPLNNGIGGGSLFIQTADATVANTGTETTLLAAGVGSLTLPANFFRTGKTIKIVAHGIYGETGTPTIRFKIKLGGTTVLDSTAVTLSGTGSATDAEWRFSCDITCRTAGAPGTLAAQGRWISDQNAADKSVTIGLANTSTVSFTTTASAAIDFTVQWGTGVPANTIKCTNLTVEASG